MTDTEARKIVYAYCGLMTRAERDEAMRKAAELGIEIIEWSGPRAAVRWRFSGGSRWRKP